MTLSAASIRLGPDGPVIEPGAPLPLAALIVGKPLAEAAEVLPRLFNICRTAQAMAARLSLGLPATGDLTTEVIRDHLLKLCVTLPNAFGLAAMAIPDDPARLLGPTGLPPGPEALLARDPLARAITTAFPEGTALCRALPDPDDPFAEGAFENSAAGRQSAHPLLRAIEAELGRGPLWRYAGLLADLEAATQDRLPRPVVTDGTARVPAARGTYALRLTKAGGRVTGIARRTPTDHLLAPAGALFQALASLPAAMHGLAPQVIALHDPCIPVTVRGQGDA